MLHRPAIGGFSLTVVLRARIVALLITNRLSLNAASTKLDKTPAWLSRKLNGRRPLTLSDVEKLSPLLLSEGKLSGALLGRVTLAPADPRGFDREELRSACSVGLAYMTDEGPRFSPLAEVAVVVRTGDTLGGVHVVEPPRQDSEFPIREGADICGSPSCPNRVFYGDQCRRHYDEGRA